MRIDKVRFWQSSDVGTMFEMILYVNTRRKRRYLVMMYEQWVSLLVNTAVISTHCDAGSGDQGMLSEALSRTIRQFNLMSIFMSRAHISSAPGSCQNGSSGGGHVTSLHGNHSAHAHWIQVCRWEFSKLKTKFKSNSRQQPQPLTLLYQIAKKRVSIDLLHFREQYDGALTPRS